MREQIIVSCHKARKKNGPKFIHQGKENPRTWIRYTTQFHRIGSRVYYFLETNYVASTYNTSWWRLDV